MTQELRLQHKTRKLCCPVLSSLRVFNSQVMKLDREIRTSHQGNNEKLRLVKSQYYHTLVFTRVDEDELTNIPSPQTY